MKKVAIILLINIYGTSTFGVSVKQFYCCGKLKSISFSLTPDAKRTCSNGIEKSGCCDTRYQFFKVKDNHIAGSQISSRFEPFIALHLYTSSIREIIFVSQKALISYRSNAPPMQTGVSLFIYNCVFRI